MTVYVETPMTQKEHRSFIGIGVALFSGIISLLAYFSNYLDRGTIIAGSIATGIGITGFILWMKYGKVEKVGGH